MANTWAHFHTWCLPPKKHEHQSVEFHLWNMGWIQYHRGEKGEKNWWYVLPNVWLKRMEHFSGILLLKREKCWYSPPEKENSKCTNLPQWRETERWQQVSSFLFTINPPLKFCNFCKKKKKKTKKRKTSRSGLKRLGYPCGYAETVLKSDPMCL